VSNRKFWYVKNVGSIIFQISSMVSVNTLTDMKTNRTQNCNSVIFIVSLRMKERHSSYNIRFLMRDKSSDSDNGRAKRHVTEKGYRHVGAFAAMAMLPVLLTVRSLCWHNRERTGLRVCVCSGIRPMFISIFIALPVVEHGSAESQDTEYENQTHYTPDPPSAAFTSQLSEVSFTFPFSITIMLICKSSCQCGG
jgi:hypothetical protein